MRHSQTDLEIIRAKNRRLYIALIFDKVMRGFEAFTKLEDYPQPTA